MKCPHCLQGFHAEFVESEILLSNSSNIGSLDKDGNWHVKATICPGCKSSSIYLLRYIRRNFSHLDLVQTMLVWPKGIARSPLSSDIPEEFTADYREACLVLTDSPKSSAALSRRCLQHLLRKKANVTKRDLSKEIQEVLDAGSLPFDLADAIDAIRNIGNFAAHPLKSANTGEILEVESGEAEWTLDVLEQLFDHYFVRPAQLAAKRAALNKKLTEAGKPPMK